ncbi:Ubiquitin carboxyl-terminal hydrolase 45 [Geodia barretti]|uniref:Ubiquitin carboxyl-terminal hydrolase 45 n=1 Tax=Geodia barretti TaxID=519541 RepID=A0AA35X8Z9_GEOBA|nr:Ubiquitin carboxyl-terminal hydrolase 45 [Geodia barretti]
MGKDGSLVTDCERCSRAQQPVDSEQVSEFTGEQVQLPESRGEDCQAEMVCKCSQSTVSDSLTSSCTSVSRDGALCNGRTAQPESLESGVVKKTPAEEEEGEEREEKGEEGEKVDLCQVTEGEEGGVRGNGKDTLGGGSGDRGGTSRETGDNSRSSSRFESTSDSESDTAMDSTPELTPERKATDEAKEEPVFRDATKQLLIKSLPPVLTLHMKRFLQDGRRLRKNGRHIDFP